MVDPASVAELAACRYGAKIICPVPGAVAYALLLLNYSATHQTSIAFDPLPVCDKFQQFLIQQTHVCDGAQLVL